MSLPQKIQRLVVELCLPLGNLLTPGSSGWPTAGSELYKYQIFKNVALYLNIYEYKHIHIHMYTLKFSFVL